MSKCVFCAITRGETPAHIVASSSDTLSFLDNRPLFPGHVLVVTRHHVETIEDLEPSLIGPLFATVQRITTAVRTALDAEGTFVAINNRVSQSVPHLHIHVVPRRSGDGLRGFFWPRTGYDDPAHMDAVRDRIVGAVQELDH
jgi:histidine triad (HIT) family protein